jgi:catechol 2,3-dioxygenase-like lactoylglutathione lyase family enzyme
MYDHVGLKVADLEKSARFYRALLAPLGYSPASADEASAGFSAEDGTTLWLYAGGAARDAHVAFQASTREAVDRFHRAGKAAGGRDNGKPGLRADYSPSYYAAFLLDPDGNNIEAVCTAE